MKVINARPDYDSHPAFGDREHAEITWLNAMENYYNLLNLSLHIGSGELVEE